MSILTFSQAIQQCGAQRPKVLLGNGFSQACLSSIFAYNSLFESADFSALSSTARAAFDKLETTDFEIVMESLRKAATLIELYSKDEGALAATFRADADGLREVLVSAIAGNHPAMPGEIDNTAYWSCRQFLSHFDRIYSVNYDLLLYWTMMHDDLPFAEEINLRADDGFRTPDDGETEYVTWEIENTNRQNVFYLHGALHLFDAGAELQKYTWCNTGVRIIDQVRTALSQHLYPVFVAEGSSISKVARIKHSDYMSRCFRSFSAIGGSLFVYGHSLADSDNHIFKAITKGKVRNLYVSLYGDSESETNQAIVEKATSLASGRTDQNVLNVYFFQAESANVWS